MKINFSDHLDKDNLSFLRSFAQGSYGTEKQINELCDKGFCELISDEETDGQVYLIKLDFNLIVFRGTSSVKVIVTDMNLIPTKTPFGFAHRGFVKTFVRLWPKLKDKIDIEKPIVITGHSLGGALAQLCALWIYQDLKVSPDLVITFAQPRIGFSKIASSTKEVLPNAFYRITKKLDFVPRLPPYFFLFKHVKNSEYKKAKDGRGLEVNFFDRHVWNLFFILLICALIYIAVFSHGIADY